MIIMLYTVADLGITNGGVQGFRARSARRKFLATGSVGVSCTACVHRVRCVLMPVWLAL